jgi:hypothetical protein
MESEVMPFESEDSFSAFSASSKVSIHSPGEFRHHTECPIIPHLTIIFYRRDDDNSHNLSVRMSDLRKIPEQNIKSDSQIYLKTATKVFFFLKKPLSKEL